MTEDGRYKRGKDLLESIHGEAGAAVMSGLGDVAPDMPKYVFEFAFGDIYSRKGLALRDRQIATLAALATLGNAQPQLKVHIQSALNLGISKEEVIEILMQMSVYAGFPAALNALATAKEAFAELDEE
ncbi:carboxymuconolactone decarboxylase family protein [Rhodobacteraceae bacterium RKSG542]|uniref:carboxymuconolactone decarboxylase family protein n=1 Tax=Pseudovibrio flavus TaxID=2529854 RepID=UPI0012BBEB76|nr:carboxymuconolactone decarboxylase family protein [Pseudovibrio flavus]MTI15708.1 carboxymuconolactone decarboxylase family protein [Pseudovibrio flavus]